MTAPPNDINSHHKTHNTKYFSRNRKNMQALILSLLNFSEIVVKYGKTEYNTDVKYA